MNYSAEQLRSSTLRFIRSLKASDSCIGTYRYSAAVSKTTLYASSYAVMTRSLYHDLTDISPEDKTAWIDYFNRHQNDDGLYSDPVIWNQGWYKGDPMWCGRPHLTCHILTALMCLGSIAKKPFLFLEYYKNNGNMTDWLEKCDWGEKISWTGNEIFNIGVLLQYARDFHDDVDAGKAVKTMLEWLSQHHIHHDTGIWGSLDISDPLQRSHSVQAAYHWWPLFFYDRFPVPYMERAIDTLLLTQNNSGGFGWGVHNRQDPFKSSACEDFDSIDPLVRMMHLTSYRRDDISAALKLAARWITKNQMEDGGFVFMLDQPFQYGHIELLGERNQGAMFPTWFRTLSLALIGEAFTKTITCKHPWCFTKCPGFHYQ